MKRFFSGDFSNEAALHSFKISILESPYSLLIKSVQFFLCIGSLVQSSKLLARTTSFSKILGVTSDSPIK